MNHLFLQGGLETMIYDLEYNCSTILDYYFIPARPVALTSLINFLYTQVTLEIHKETAGERITVK